MSDERNEAPTDVEVLTQYRAFEAQNPIFAARFRLENRDAITRAMTAEQAASAPPLPEPDPDALLVQAEIKKQEAAQQQAFAELKAQYEQLKAVNPILASRFALANGIFR